MPLGSSLLSMIRMNNATVVLRLSRVIVAVDRSATVVSGTSTVHKHSAAKTQSYAVHTKLTMPTILS